MRGKEREENGTYILIALHPTVIYLWPKQYDMLNMTALPPLVKLSGSALYLP